MHEEREVAINMVGGEGEQNKPCNMESKDCFLECLSNKLDRDMVRDTVGCTVPGSYAEEEEIVDITESIHKAGWSVQSYLSSVESYLGEHWELFRTSFVLCRDVTADDVEQASMFNQTGYEASLYDYRFDDVVSEKVPGLYEYKLVEEADSSMRYVALESDSV